MKAATLFCTTAALACCAPALAQQPEKSGNAGPVYDSFLTLMPIGNLVDAMSLDQLADTVVTESKVAQSQDSITQKIVALHMEDFEQQTTYNRNLAELMSYTSGQFVNVLSRGDANWGSYAGLGPKYNSYLLDGLPIDSFADAMSLDSWAFERVEAYKGPASVLYANYLSMDFAGNEAPLAGTTNFILKDRVQAPMTRFLAGYGSWGTWNGRMYHQNRAGNLSYLFGANLERANYTQYGDPGSWLQTTQSPAYEKRKIYGKLSYALGRDDHRLSLFFHRTDQKGDLGRPARDFDHDYNTVNLAYDNQLTKELHVQAKAGLRTYDRYFGNDNYPTSLVSTGHSDTRQRIVPADLTLSYSHERGLLTFGIDNQTVHYQTHSISTAGVTTPDNDVKARSSGLFLQEKIQVGDWVLRAGVRHSSTRHEYALLGGRVPATTTASWQKTLWSMGARYDFSPALSLYANTGTSFMAPAAKQVGGSLDSSGNGQLPNPALKPESGVGSDFGLDWHQSPNLTVGMRAFLNRIDDAIIDNAVTGTTSQSINAGSATAKGFELDIQHVWSANTQWFGNLTYTNTKVENPRDANNDGTAIPFAPDWVANLGLTGKLPWGITASPYYHWVGRYYDSTSRSGRTAFGHYGVMNVRLQKNLERDANHAVTLALDLNNLLDRRFAMPWNFQDPGFNAFASVQVVF